VALSVQLDGSLANRLCQNGDKAERQYAKMATPKRQQIVLTKTESSKNGHKSVCLFPLLESLCIRNLLDGSKHIVSTRRNRSLSRICSKPNTEVIVHCRIILYHHHHRRLWTQANASKSASLATCN